MPKARTSNLLRFNFLNRISQPTQKSLSSCRADALNVLADPPSRPIVKSQPSKSSRDSTQVNPRFQSSSRDSPICVRHSQVTTRSSHTFKQTDTGSASRSKKDLLRPTITLQSGYGSLTSVIIVSAVTAIYYAYSFSGYNIEQDERPTQDSTERTPQTTEAIYFGDFDMSQENQVGRVGHLTAEEEEKLKEFWVVTLEVFGVLDKAPPDIAGNGKVDSDLGDSKKQKKKRMSMFRRSNKDGTDSNASSDSGSKAGTHGADADDKYGQTKEFHEALANQSPESLRATFWSMVKHDHPDALLLRFLRARKWDVNKALHMMIATMRWRATDVHVDDDVMKNGELTALADANGSDPAKKKLAEDFLAQMRMGKSFFHGHDKEGRPMCFVRARLHKQGEQSEESLEKYTVFTIETGRMILTPPTDTACVVFDLTGFSMANMDYGPVKFMIKCFEANYPESLGVVLVHKAPWIFQGIWKIIRGWLDPVVASKVNFTNNEKEMEQFVPKANILKELGGEEDWSYTYTEPSPNENDRMKDTVTRDKLLLEREEVVKQYESATKAWIDDTDVAAAKETRLRLANNLREGYWVLDPYVRARSYYDRVGLIGSDGKPHFYPSRDGASVPAPPSNGAPKLETSAADLD